jgi:hypothetical protein
MDALASPFAFANEQCALLSKKHSLFLQAQPRPSSLQEFHEDFPKLQFLENLP